MTGVLVIDKPQGLTSHDVVATARRTLGEKKIGHTGTLDPLATGVLPLAIGRATRLARFLAASDKDYEAGIRFGLTTDTYDITGRELCRTDATPSQDDVMRALQTLTGEYLQTPPAYSAKKVDGRRAYDLIRSERAVVLTPVPVRVTCAAAARLQRAQRAHRAYMLGRLLRAILRTHARSAGRHRSVSRSAAAYSKRRFHTRERASP